MNDRFGRKIDYLRISITDRCNLRCLYCMPEEGVERLSHSDVLRYEEIETVARAAAEAGVTKIRVTGGEPLVRPGVVGLVGLLSAIDGIEDLSLTTNAVRLGEFAGPLAEAGLNRVNISLDTLDPEQFGKITRVGRIEDVFRGIDAARDAGLSPIKVNTVVIRGFNDSELVGLSEWALENSLHLRFIEFMPVNDSSFQFDDRHLSSDDIRRTVFSRFPDMRQCAHSGGGPAVNWKREGVEGSLGVIEAVSHSFCGSCNRIRLTADGKLRPCLFSDKETDLLPVLRGGSPDVHKRIRRLIDDTIGMKPESHDNFKGIGEKSRCMNEIGG